MCRFDEFTCDDGQTCIAWEKICDGQDDCPQHENGPGGEDEVLGKSNLGDFHKRLATFSS